MASKLDQLVKGATPSTMGAQQHRISPDPTSLVPSSPPQIYLNLLILEASLRSQYLSLLSRRRQNTLVLLILALYLGYTTYLVFLRPREDGNGVGGSVYWVLDRCQKISWLGGVVMTVLFRVTGQWERGIRWPRRWLGATNRGLRRFNCKAVMLKRPWWRETVSHLAFLVPYGLLYPTPGSSYHRVEYTQAEKARLRQHQQVRRSSSSAGSGATAVMGNGSVREELPEEDLAPGGDVLKLILLPKPFSADFREEWEVFRARYWDAENTRRKALLVRVHSRQREIARKEGGWLWWTGWRGWAHFRGPPPQPHHPHHHHHHGLSHQGSISGRSGTHRRRESLLKDRTDRSGSHSRSSSRSSISLTPDVDDTRVGRERRASNSSTTSDRRRKHAPSMTSATGQTITSSRPGTGTGTGVPGPFAFPRSSSRLSESSSRPGTPRESAPA